MTYRQKLTKIGNSIGIVLPKQLLESLGLGLGNEIYVEQINDKLILETKKSSKVSPEFLRIAESIGERYSVAFKELSK